MYTVSKPAIEFMNKELFLAGISCVHPLSEYDPSFEQLKEDHKAGTAYVFSGGSCVDTVFGGDHEAQLVYRAWHDTLHIKHDIGFSKTEELKLAEIIGEELLAAGFDRDAYLLRTDLHLHINYFYNHNKHPVRQLDMIKEYELGYFSSGAIPATY